MMKSPIKDGNTEEEEASIMTDLDYHDTINAEMYEKYFETFCKLLKPNSVTVINNASYHSGNADNFPVSKWRKGELNPYLDRDLKNSLRADSAPLLTPLPCIRTKPNLVWANTII